MSQPIFFDHIEVHVKDIMAYCLFLKKIFNGGRYEIISENGTSMFLSNDGLHIEVKISEVKGGPNNYGFGFPCLRMAGARDHIENNLGFKIEKTINNPDGDVFFFTDMEGITWHIKDYLVLDKYVNI